MAGAERMLEALVAEAHRRGWQQRVLNPYARAADTRELQAVTADASYAAYPASRPWHLPGLRGWLAHEIDAFGPDILHVHLFHAEVSVASLRHPSARVKILTHHHGRHLISAKRWLATALDALAVRRYDRVVACSESVGRFLRSTYKLRDDRLDVIANGWQGEPREPDPAATKTVICVAQFRPEKNHEVLIQAFRRVLDRGVDARLVLVGDGELRTQLEDRVTRAGMGEKVDFLGFVDDVWSPLSRAHLFVLPSREEPFGIAAAEAMAAGLPVLASHVGGLQDLVDPDVTGVLVESDDVAGWASAMVALLEDEDRRQKMGDAARVASARWSIAHTIEEYFDLYERKLGRAASRGGRD